MSYINKEGKVTSVRLMIIRQQISDVISYGKITTTLTKAKETKRFLERLITTAKRADLAANRKIASVVLRTKLDDQDSLLKKTLELGKKYLKRPGGYARILKLGSRPGDRTEEAILELV
jgi:large subunit ribosomal protein L17